MEEEEDLYGDQVADKTAESWDEEMWTIGAYSEGEM